MATQILFKAEKKFVDEIDKAVKEGNYQSRTEFIRESLRKNIDEKRQQKAIEQIAKIRGSLKINTTQEELDKIREKAWEEYSKRFK